jgi:phage shock protein C
MRTNRVARSLTDRVLGGVCGGLSAYLGINPWWARGLFLVLAVLSSGAAAVLYLMLWWMLPVDLTPDEPQPGRDLVRLLSVAGLIILVGLLILAQGMDALRGPGGLDLFWPGMVLLLGAALVWQQLRTA